jgi:hypothetical protein
MQLNPVSAFAAALAGAITLATVWACSSSGGNGTGPGGTNVSLSGCVPNDDAGTCSAQGCFCNRGGCSFTCGTPVEGGINVDCAQTSCTGTCQQSCNFDCSQGQCSVDVGSGSTVDCSQATGCTGTVGADASVNCLQASCTLTLGQGDTVVCEQAHACDLTCTGDCTASCEQATSCTLHCAQGTPTTCSDTITHVCGAAKCP